jgi:RNA polymerase sigma-70 factor (ECF subfamily)
LSRLGNLRLLYQRQVVPRTAKICVTFTVNHPPEPRNRVHEMDDEQLIAAVAAGNDRALRELFDRYAPLLAARLRRLLPAAAVEDVLQETFIALWHGAGGYAARGEPGAWLWGIARRQAALWSRRHGRPEVLAAPERDDDTASKAIRNVDLRRAFADLGPAGSAQQELARLAFVEERKMAEIAAHFGIPAGTVKSRIFKLRRLLQAALGQGAG